MHRIASIDQANAYLEKTFLPEFNRRFTKDARDLADAHRHWPRELKAEEVLCVREERTVSRDWCVLFQRRVLQLDPRHQSLGLAGRRVTVLQLAGGELQVEHQGRRLTFDELALREPVKHANRQPDLRPLILKPAAGTLRPPGAATLASPSAAPRVLQALRHPERTVLMRR